MLKVFSYLAPPESKQYLQRKEQLEKLNYHVDEPWLRKKKVQ